MKILLASAPVINREQEFNLQTILEYMKTYRGRAELIVFGEAVLQGFDCLCWNYEEDQAVAAALTDAPIVKLRAAAKTYHMAVSFGMIERRDGSLYSAQLFIGADGEIVNVFRRVSPGWKAFSQTDEHYREGARFEKFSYHGKTFAVGLCGDLWTEGRPEEMKALNADVVLWPVWCDYTPAEWNGTVKQEYARQAARCGKNVLLVNPFCAGSQSPESAAGACVHFRDGVIVQEHPSGKPGVLPVFL